MLKEGYVSFSVAIQEGRILMLSNRNCNKDILSVCVSCWCNTAGYWTGCEEHVFMEAPSIIVWVIRSQYCNLQPPFELISVCCAKEFSRWYADVTVPWRLQRVVPSWTWWAYLLSLTLCKTSGWLFLSSEYINAEWRITSEKKTHPNNLFFFSLHHDLMVQEKLVDCLGTKCFVCDLPSCTFIVKDLVKAHARGV